MASFAGKAWGCDGEVVILNAGDDSFWVPSKIGETPMPFPDCEVVIGLSILQRGVFIYDGLQGKFPLTWS
jgi:hypothetical protein